MHAHWFGLIAFLSTGCFSNWEAKDADGDGVVGVNDCWESLEDPVSPVGAMQYDTPVRAADIFVGAEDRPYDGIDQNCDGLDDFDQDGDGFVPNDYVGIQTLGLGETGTLSGGDCDDEDAVRHPDTEELCDGVINGCDTTLLDNEVDGDGDGFVLCSIVDSGWEGEADVVGGDDCDDEDALLFPTQVWYVDADVDMFGDAEASQISCQQPSGYVLDSTDCNDDDATVFPEAPELCDGIENACGVALDAVEIDDDGDGYVDCEIDVDGWDGEASVVGGDDCSDSDGTVHISQTYFLDSDQDNFGDPNTSIRACEQPVGYLLDSNDCNDDDATVYLNAPELCDGQSNACSVSIPSDEIDDDNDGFVECTIDFAGWDGSSSVVDGGDCDDFDAMEFPGQTWYADFDQDGFGNSALNQVSCQQPSNTSLLSTDCDDSDNTVYPSASELCDGQLNDCSGTILAGEVDGDGDGVSICALDSGGWDGDGTVTAGNDCVDDDPFTFPGAASNDSLNDCMRDNDGDGFGDSSVLGGFVGGTDCNDADGTIYPTAPEICDGLVNTCGGTLPIDEIDNDGDGFVECSFASDGWDGDPTVTGGEDCNDSVVGGALEFPTQTWYEDADSDGFGGDIAMSSCAQPASFEAITGDCDDADPFTYPNAIEICDGMVNTCGGNLPSDEIDDDADGYVDCVTDSSGWNGAIIDGDGDCDDTDAFTYPGSASADSGTLCMKDSDLDGFGDSALGFLFTPGTDCNDDEGTVYSNAPELCDGQLNACFTGGIPFDELDIDADGFVECEIDANGWDGASSIEGGGDCNANNANIYPYAPEDADAIDDNCDGIEATKNITSCVGSMGNFAGVDKYFLYCNVNRSPGGASFVCQDSGYDDLASIHSISENTFAANLASNSFLIGYNRNANGQPWTWRDGTNTTYEFSSFDQSGSGTLTDTVVEFSGSSSNVSQWRGVAANVATKFMCSRTF